MFLDLKFVHYAFYTRKTEVREHASYNNEFLERVQVVNDIKELRYRAGVMVYILEAPRIECTAQTSNSCRWWSGPGRGNASH